MDQLLFKESGNTLLHHPRMPWLEWPRASADFRMTAMLQASAHTAMHGTGTKLGVEDHAAGVKALMWSNLFPSWTRPPEGWTCAALRHLSAGSPASASRTHLIG